MMENKDDLTYDVFTAAHDFYDSVPEPKPSFTEWYYGDGGLYEAVTRSIRKIMINEIPREIL